MGYNVLSKSCKRCGGDLFLEWDAHEASYACIQCSAVEENYTKLLRANLRATGIFLKQDKPKETHHLN